MKQSLQQQYWPEGTCFGCGPANEKGLQLNSFVEGDKLVATWQAQEHHQAFPGVLNGGVIGALLDCHSNWTAAWHLMQQHGDAHPPCTVTSDFAVKLKRPTPMDEPIQLIAEVVSSKEDRVTIYAELIAHGKVCATCEGTFVAVKPGHPAYHRW